MLQRDCILEKRQTVVLNFADGIPVNVGSNYRKTQKVKWLPLVGMPPLKVSSSRNFGNQLGLESSDIEAPLGSMGWVSSSQSHSCLRELLICGEKQNLIWKTIFEMCQLYLIFSFCGTCGCPLAGPGLK